MAVGLLLILAGVWLLARLFKAGLAHQIVTQIT